MIQLLLVAKKKYVECAMCFMCEGGGAMSSGTTHPPIHPSTQAKFIHVLLLLLLGSQVIRAVTAISLHNRYYLLRVDHLLCCCLRIEEFTFTIVNHILLIG